MNEPHSASLFVRHRYRTEGATYERERIIKLIERNICFDAIADSDGRCGNHGGKCYELRLLINTLEEMNEL